MTSPSMQHRFTRIASATGLVLGLVCASSAALADGGVITSVTATPASVFQDAPFTISVKAKGSLGVNCSMAWHIEDATKTTVKSGKSQMSSTNADADATAEYTTTTSLPKAGTFTIFAGPPQTGKTYELCNEPKSIDIVIKDKSLPSSTPVAKVSPSPTQRVSPGTKAQGLVNGVPAKP